MGEDGSIGDAWKEKELVGTLIVGMLTEDAETVLCIEICGPCVEIVGSTTEETASGEGEML